MPTVNAGLKCSGRILPNGGSPYGSVRLQSASRGLLFLVAVTIDIDIMAAGRARASAGLESFTLASVRILRWLPRCADTVCEHE